MAGDFEAAAAAWNAAHPEHYPRQHGTCPACGGGGCFGTVPGSNGETWACFDTDHAGTNVGREGDGCWGGDALDLAAHRRNETRAAVLRADGYLTGDAPPVEARRAPVPKPTAPPLALPPLAGRKGGRMDGWKLAGWKGKNYADTQGAALVLTWDELLARFRTPHELPAGPDMDARKRELPWWGAAIFDGKRGADTVGKVSALVLDLDSDPSKPGPARGEPDLSPDRLRELLGEVLPGAAWAAHTTPKSTAGAWRWRVVVPLATPLDPPAYVALVDLLRLKLLSESTAPFALEADTGSNRGPSRLWFAPARVPERPDDYAAIDAAGVPMASAELLAELARDEGLDLAALAIRLAGACEAKRNEHAERERAERKAEEKRKADAAKAAESVGKLEWFTPPAAWLADAPPFREYLLHDAPESGAFALRGAGMLPRGKVGILAAAGGVGKTFALTGLALSLVTGAKWLGNFPTGDNLRRRVVLVLGEEDIGEVQRRLHAQARAMELDPAKYGPALAGIHALAGAGLDTLALTRPTDEPGIGAGTAFADGLYAYLEAHGGNGWDAVILDPLSRFAGPDVETDNSAATRLVQVLERFTKLPGSPAVIVAHHTTKASRSEGEIGATAVRGSSALTDGARWVGTLDPVVVKGGAKLPGHARFRVAKQNYGVFPDRALLLTKPVGGEGGLRAATDAESEALRKAEEDAERAAGEKEGRQKAARSEGVKAGKETAKGGSKRTPDPDL